MVSYEARCILMLLKDLAESKTITPQAVIELAHVVAKGEHFTLGWQIAADHKQRATR